MKYVKKISSFILIAFILLVNLYIPSNVSKVEAKTLRTLKEELAAKEAELENSNNQKRLTEEEIASKKRGIDAINEQIVSIQEETVALTEEIEKLNEEIKEKEAEIKQIMNYYQLSTSESAYLEYVFEAKDFTDFIYRMAVTEQLSKYNEELVDEYNNKINENEQKKKDLAQKQISLNDKQAQLQVELESLGTQLGEILDENVTLEDDIKSMKKLINTYENVYNCDLDEDVNSCGMGKLPAGTAFFRPVIEGMVSANYGTYYPWGYPMMHYGMDIAGTGHGANVYSMADGKVAYITERASCGGNMLYIWHNINGVEYTTGYFHLGSINVSVGETVTTETVIGTVGGNPYYEYWDSCSTGTHLHIQFAYSNIPAGVGFYTKFTAKSFNPRNVLNLPYEGGWFSNRYSEY